MSHSIWADQSDLFAAATMCLPVLWAVRVGSRVYGTADAESDHDYVVVLRSGSLQSGHKDSDLIKYASGGAHLDIMVRTQEGFVSSLTNQNVFAIECCWTPPMHIIRGSDLLRGLQVGWRMNPPQLRAQAIEKSNSDYGHYLSAYSSGEPCARRDRKRLWHSLRVPLFAAQVLQHGRLIDYTGAMCIYEDIMTDPNLDPNHWGQVRQDLLSKIY